MIGFFDIMTEDYSGTSDKRRCLIRPEYIQAVTISGSFHQYELNEGIMRTAFGRMKVGAPSQKAIEDDMRICRKNRDSIVEAGEIALGDDSNRGRYFVQDESGGRYSSSLVDVRDIVMIRELDKGSSVVVKDGDSFVNVISPRSVSGIARDIESCSTPVAERSTALAESRSPVTQSRSIMAETKLGDIVSMRDSQLADPLYSGDDEDTPAG